MFPYVVSKTRRPKIDAVGFAGGPIRTLFANPTGGKALPRVGDLSAVKVLCDGLSLLWVPGFVDVVTGIWQMWFDVGNPVSDCGPRPPPD